MAEPKRVRFDHLIGVYSVGSGDWPWIEEYENLIDQPDTQKLLERIRVEGIREPILLGTDGRVWDGHHRIIIAMHLGLDSVPVEFAGEPGALVAHDAEVRASVQGDAKLPGNSGAEEPEWEYGYESIADAEAERPTMRRRKAGPWLPVEQEEE